MEKPPLIICCTEQTDEGWRKCARLLKAKQVLWRFFCATPRGFFERLIKFPNLAITRACWQAVREAKRSSAALFITSDAKVTFRCALFSQWLGVKISHIAYSFNFPELPRGLKRRLMAYAFKHVEKFIVHSAYEKKIYHEYFGIPTKRIKVILWGVGVPQYEPEEPLEPGDYICAIGGNARDYETLMLAMETLPDVRLVVITRKHDFEECRKPENVRILTDASLNHAMNILKHSRFMVLPLKGSEVPCGHVTLVAAMHLGKAFIITKSLGVSDYVMEGHNAVTCEALEKDSLARAIRFLWDNPAECKRLGENGRCFANEHCSETASLEQLRELLIEKNLWR